MKTIQNPITGRKIAVGGPTYQKLLENPTYRDQIRKLASMAKTRAVRKNVKIMIAKRKNLKTRKIKRSRTANLRKSIEKQGIRLSQVKKLPGRGSLGKYSPSEGLFCGPEGGAGEYTYPVNTKKRAINAVSRSVNAPNPRGIRQCAVRHAIKKGWMTKEHGQELINKY